MQKQESKKKRKSKKPQNRHKTGFRGPSPDVGKSTQFKPGQSGNPGGRPVTKPLTDALREILDADPKLRKKIAAAMLRKCSKGSVVHFSEVTNRIEGKVSQATEVTGPGGSQFELIVRHVGVGAKPDAS